MKIGIISINAHTKSLNLACPLHTWAFQQFLLNNGIDNVIIDYEPNITHSNSFNSREPYSHYVEVCERKYKALENAQTEEERENLRKDIERMEIYRDGYKALGKERASRYDKREEFVNKYYVKTDRLYTTEDLEFDDPGFDCYICASDVIWRLPAEGFDLGLFLASSTMENKYKIAYAASRGVPKPYKPEELEQFRHYMEDIDHLGVREESLAEFIEELTGRDSTVVLDPVMLHDADFYEKVLVKPEEEDFVLVYSPEERTSTATRAAEKYCREHGKKMVEISSIPLTDGLFGGNYSVEHIFKYDVSPEEWLGYLRYADHIFTNSFHAVCFSILFKKNFSVGSRNGDKVQLLMKRFHLDDRLVDKKGRTPSYMKKSKAGKYLYRAMKKLGLVDPNKVGNYDEVYRILDVERKKSADYILGAIRDLEERQPVKNTDYDSWKKQIRYAVEYDGSDCGTVSNSGENRLGDCIGAAADSSYALRIKIIDYWYYLCKTESGKADLIKETELADFLGSGKDADGLLFKADDSIPFIPVNQINKMQVIAVKGNDLSVLKEL